MKKSELRRLCRQNIDPLTHATKISYNLNLCEHLKRHLSLWEHTHIGMFWPLPWEPDIRVLFTQHNPISLPAMDNHRPCFRRWDGSPQSLTRINGFLQPPSDAMITHPQVVVVPCLGFHRDGYRLGYGGGFYDRWLAANPQTKAIGIAYDEGAIEDFPLESHDCKLTVIITPTQIIT